MTLEGEPISPELVLVSPELRRARPAAAGGGRRAGGARPAAPARAAADPLRSGAVASSCGATAGDHETSPGHRRVRTAIFSKMRKTGAAIAFCVVEVVIVVAAVLIVKVIMG